MIGFGFANVGLLVDVGLSVIAEAVSTIVVVVFLAVVGKEVVKSTGEIRVIRVTVVAILQEASVARDGSMAG